MKAHAWLVSAALLAATSAAAQPLAIERRGPTEGIALPPTSLALAEEATAPEINPAALGSLGGPQLLYLHERDLRLGSVGDGLFLGSELVSGLDLGFAVQWIRPQSGPDFRKTTWTAALGGRELSLGIGMNLFASADSAALDRLHTLDLGLTIRPFRFLSVAGVVRDVDAPALEGARLPRRWGLGLGIRPFTDRVGLGVDFEADDRRGLRGTRVAGVVTAEPVDGLVLQAGAGQGLKDGELVGQLGLTLNGAHVGAGYAYGASRDELGDASHVVQVRLSGDRYRPIQMGLKRRYVVVDLAERLRDPPGQFDLVLGPSGREPFLETLAFLSQLEEDPEVAGVLLKITTLPDLGWGRVEDLRAELEALKGRGKKVVAALLDGGDPEFMLASAADKVYSVPQATLLVNGLSSTEVFFAEGLEKLGVTVDVARVGAYKNAPDSFTRRDMSEEQRQSLSRYLDDVFGRYVSVAAKGRRLEEGKLREALDQGILTPKMAKEAGLIDAVAYPDELPDLVKELEGRAVEFVTDYGGRPDFPAPWGGRPVIAVINVVGLIAEGKSRSDPLGAAQVAGAESIIKAVERALRDDQVKAVLVRVDSGGGSGAASDLIWRALMKLRERKPVVVSLGDVAASGGYYVAMAGQEVLAEPTTLTGSIGVFALKPSFGGLLGKLGINEVTLKRGERADLFGISRPWTEGERQAVQRYVDEFYEEFVAKVAESRKLDRAKVGPLAEGRIWSGKAAKELGLVDELGGFAQALERAKARAGLAGADVEVQVLRDDDDRLGLRFETEQARQLARLVSELSGGWGLALAELGAGPLALLPARYQIR